MRMLTDHVLVTEVKKQETSVGGIILTDNISKAAMPGLVQLVGPDVVGIEQGDQIFLEWPKTMAVDVDGNPAVIVKAEFIKAVL